jgi:hypothetical protein
LDKTFTEEKKMDYSLYTNGLSEEEQMAMLLKMSVEENEPEKKEVVEDDINLKNTKIISQWVKSATASSQYGGWIPSNMVGEANTYPKYGDLKTA